MYKNPKNNFLYSFLEFRKTTITIITNIIPII